jgi:hypothetical protein
MDREQGEGESGRRCGEHRHGHDLCSPCGDVKVATDKERACGSGDAEDRDGDCCGRDGQHEDGRGADALTRHQVRSSGRDQ